MMNLFMHYKTNTVTFDVSICSLEQEAALWCTSACGNNGNVMYANEPVHFTITL